MIIYELSWNWKIILTGQNMARPFIDIFVYYYGEYL